ncbi:hypothetical protein FALBO_15412 [Fusarium albosuccineum]|uniref:HTH CENPB-type domain-containing protein n=1 Tax=Fusarium albosuccineum TaxID=1237068 RepID=A0A8H4P404_9HYPO|nr:hypothetical protein FALBO_15412 [Fusarium albosuccineum]
MSRRRDGVQPLRSWSRSLRSRRLSDAEEQVIVQFIVDLVSRGSPPRLRYIEETANRLLGDRDASPVSQHWASNFVKRHPVLRELFLEHFGASHEEPASSSDRPTVPEDAGDDARQWADMLPISRHLASRVHLLGIQLREARGRSLALAKRQARLVLKDLQTLYNGQVALLSKLKTEHRLLRLENRRLRLENRRLGLEDRRLGRRQSSRLHKRRIAGVE